MTTRILALAAASVCGLSCRYQTDRERVAVSDWRVPTSPPPLELRRLDSTALHAWPSPPADVVGSAAYTPKLIAASGPPTCLVAIGDALNRRIHVFHSSGAYVTTHKLQLRAPAPIETMTSLAINAGGELFVSDSHQRSYMRWKSALDELPVALGTIRDSAFGISESLHDLPGHRILVAHLPLESSFLELPPVFTEYDVNGDLIAAWGAGDLVPSPEFSAALNTGLVGVGGTGFVWVRNASPVLKRYTMLGDSQWRLDSTLLPDVRTAQPPTRVRLGAASAAAAARPPVAIATTMLGIAVDDSNRIVLIQALPATNARLSVASKPPIAVRAVSADLTTHPLVDIGAASGIALTGSTAYFVLDDTVSLSSAGVQRRFVVELADSLLFGTSASNRYTTCASR